MVLLGVTHEDRPAQVQWLARKVRELRIMREERSAADWGRRFWWSASSRSTATRARAAGPTWQAAAPGEVSEPLYEAFVAELERLDSPVQRGVFGADMAVELVNDGPVTVILESP